MYFYFLEQYFFYRSTDKYTYKVIAWMKVQYGEKNAWQQRNSHEAEAECYLNC